MYYPVTAQLICIFVFAYANCCFFHVVTHMYVYKSVAILQYLLDEIH